MSRPRLTRLLTLALFVTAIVPASAVAAWTPPARVSTSGQDASAPRMAENGAGKAVLIWQRSDGANDRIQVRARAASGSLGPIRTVSAPGRDAAAPQVAIDGEGDAVLTWLRFDGTNWRAQGRARSAGGVLSPVETLSAAGQDARHPEVGMDEQGDTVFTWTRYDGSDWRIQARARSAAAHLGQSRTISAAGEDAYHPEVAVAAAGRAVIAWDRFDGSAAGCCQRIQALTRSAEGSLARCGRSRRRIPMTPPLGHRSPLSRRAAQCSPGGDPPSRSEEIRGRTGDRAVRSGRPQPRPDPLARRAVRLSSPEVAADGSGGAIFTWQRTERSVSPAQIESRTRSAAGDLGPVQALTPPDSETYAAAPQVGVDGSGDSVFTWDTESIFGEDLAVEARTRAPAGDLGAIQTLSRPGRSTLNPQVAVDHAGQALATWQADGGAHTVIQVASGP